MASWRSNEIILLLHRLTMDNCCLVASAQHSKAVAYSSQPVPLFGPDLKAFSSQGLPSLFLMLYSSLQTIPRPGLPSRFLARYLPSGITRLRSIYGRACEWSQKTSTYLQMDFVCSMRIKECFTHDIARAVCNLQFQQRTDNRQAIRRNRRRKNLWLTCKKIHEQDVT